MIRNDYLNIFSHKIESTPAHFALKILIDTLRAYKKSIYVYTDNKDDIDFKVGIQSSFKRVEDNTIVVDLPKLIQKKTTVVVCGQSVDFDSHLSTPYTRRHDAQSVSFFSLNTQSNNIAVRDGFDRDTDIECWRKGESKPFFNYNSPIIGMLSIPDSLQNTLPALCNSIKE